MTLSDAIIHGQYDQVLRMLKQSTNPQDVVNDIDVYGFTPLIEAAIANNAKMAALLLEYGAKPNDPDLTGGTALHWAVENNNEALCTLLLKRGADPNGYTASGQPVLVKPLLRGQIALRELLRKHGGSLEFARDYINAKLLGHRFELVGKVYLPDVKGKFTEVDFEGFILEFTVNVIRESFLTFKNHFMARKLRTYFPLMQVVVDALRAASELLKYQQYMVNRAEHQRSIDQLAELNPLILPIGYEGHAITFVRYGDLFAKCDRGENSLHGHSVVIYRMGQPQRFNAEFVRKALYEKHSSRFVNTDIFTWLELQPITHLPLHTQVSGNCSWANVEAAIPTLLFMLLLQESTGDIRVTIRHKASVLSVHRQWATWDKYRALHHCIESFYTADKPGKASKVALLAAVLLQLCKDRVPRETDKIHAMLSILTLPAYRYALKAYLKVYTQQNKTYVGKNLKELLDLCGYDISDFV